MTPNDLKHFFDLTPLYKKYGLNMTSLKLMAYIHCVREKK